MVASHPMIEFHRLHRYFGRTQAVHDVSFEVPRGTAFGYIGHNGAGKTTSMRIVATLDLPTYGDARVDGFSVVNDPDRVRKRLGYMPDSYGAYPYVNCLEYLDFFARAYGLVGRERTRAIRRVLDFTRLHPLAEKPMDGLSKGMKQRLCLGRALIHDPAVLILDEPAAGLDPLARIELREMIRQLAADGKAVLISSHILTELAEMCDRVAIVKLGRLVAVGTIDEIQRGIRAHREVRMQVVENTSGLIAWLSQRPEFFDIHQDAHDVRFSHHGDTREEARFLKEIIDAGFLVIKFGANAHSLEQVFLRVTQGAVQ